MERVKAINKYYVHLEYNNVTNTSVEINKLFNKMLLKQKVSHIKRMEILSFMIEKNFSLFVSLYKHIDVVMAIIRYLYNISEKFKDDVTYPTYNNDSEYGLVMIITILLNIRKDISAQMLIQSFLVMALQKPIDMLPENEIFFHEYEHICEMIILKDSDLHAIINCLKITENYNFIKIWVQEPVIKKFLWFTKKYNNLDLSSSIHTFQSLKDIKLCAYNDFSINIVSIWSENILAAKNFALSLNKCTVFINSYMEYDGDLMFLPYLDIYYRKKKEITFNLRCKINSDKSDLIESKSEIYLSNVPETNSLIYHLFYDGMWQKPIRNTYWKHNDILWANATISDIVKCYESAKKGFEIWSDKSSKLRIKILSNLIPMLISIGKPVLATIVERWINFSNIYPNVIGFISPAAKIEVMHSRVPLGVIILKEENENVLFVRLLLTLITGNTAIIINDANYYNILPYCEMFTTCGIPTGVINSLSCKNISLLEDTLCLGQRYSDYIKIFFIKGKSIESYIQSQKNLTLSRLIIFPF